VHRRRLSLYRDSAEIDKPQPVITGVHDVSIKKCRLEVVK